MAVSKPNRPPDEVDEIIEEPKTTIRVGEKDYPIPNLTLKQYKQMLKTLSDDELDNMTEEQSLEFTKDFYFKLLKFENPNLKRTDLDEMPIYQFSAEFVIKVKLAMFQAPFGR